MKAPNETLALGERIVRELKVDRRGDTLSRWLCHHLAELLVAERSASGDERKEVQSEAVDTILKIWDNRHNLPGDAHPLKRLEGVLKTMRLLDVGAWPYSRREDDTDDALARIYEGLRSVVIHRAMLALAGREKDEDAKTIGDHLDDDEREILETANRWAEATSQWKYIPLVILNSESEKEAYSELKAEEERIAALDPLDQSKARLLQKIDTTITSLEFLRDELSHEGAN